MNGDDKKVKVFEMGTWQPFDFGFEKNLLGAKKENLFSVYIRFFWFVFKIGRRNWPPENWWFLQEAIIPRKYWIRTYFKRVA